MFASEYTAAPVIPLFIEVLAAFTEDRAAFTASTASLMVANVDSLPGGTTLTD